MQELHSLPTIYKDKIEYYKDKIESFLRSNDRFYTIQKFHFDIYHILENIFLVLSRYCHTSFSLIYDYFILASLKQSRVDILITKICPLLFEDYVIVITDNKEKRIPLTDIKNVDLLEIDDIKIIPKDNDTYNEVESLFIKAINLKEKLDNLLQLETELLSLLQTAIIFAKNKDDIMFNETLKQIDKLISGVK